MDRTFPHRRDVHGFYVSFCPVCFRTIATEKKESDLWPYEHLHVCDPDEVELRELHDVKIAPG